MENLIKNEIKTFIDRCNDLEKEMIDSDGNIKEEYQENIIDRYQELISSFENSISTDMFNISVTYSTEMIKKFYIMYYLFDERLYKQLSKNIKDNPGWKAEAQIRLYMMFLKTFREALFLLGGGFSDCSLARTRRLYELGVYISIINTNSEDLAERFCKYSNVQRLAVSKGVFDRKKVKGIKKHIKQLNFENEFENEYGWANILFPKDDKIYFSSLANLTKYKDFYSLYKVSCNFVHGSIFSSLESLDNSKEQRGKNIWNTSPSNEGIDEVIYFLKIYLMSFLMNYKEHFKINDKIEDMVMLSLIGTESMEDII